MKRSLIVTADDVGLHPGMVAGALEAHRRGIVTACSVVASGKDLENSVNRLRETPTIDVGIHLTLVEERPVLQPQRVRSLVTTRGRFHASYRAFLMRYFAGAIRMAEVESELRAQIELLLGRGLPLRHANSHQHLHVLPKLWERVLRLANEYRIGYVRIPDDPIPDDAGLSRAVSIRALNYFGRKARAAGTGGVVVNDRTIGVAEAGSLTVARIAGLLEEVRGVTELVTHPAVGAADIENEYAWGYSWDRETAALCDPSLKVAIANAGITLTTPCGVAGGQ
ncbi:MAG: carbohydrate deacetylase [Thermoanaerobaculia bacterium]